MDRRHFLSIAGLGALSGAAKAGGREPQLLVIGAGTGGTSLQHRLQQELPYDRFLAIDSPRVEPASIGRAHTIDLPAASMREGRWLARPMSPFAARLMKRLPRDVDTAVLLLGLGGATGTAAAYAAALLLHDLGVSMRIFATTPSRHEPEARHRLARRTVRDLEKHGLDLDLEEVRPYGRCIASPKQPWWDTRERLVGRVVRELKV